MHIETERKYIVRLPDFEALASLPGYSKSDIEQIYLPSEPGQTRRIRRRTHTDKTVYTKTVKTRISPMSAYEDEHEITEEEYMELRKGRDRSHHVVNKQRYTFIYKNTLFELDVYPFWKRTCLLECELRNEKVIVELPPFLRIVKDVTGERRYSNASIAKTIPSEESVS